MNNTVDVMAKTVDESTKYLLPSEKRLLLLGTEDSIFLRQIHRKAKSFGIQCDLTTYPAGYYDAAVVDNSTQYMEYYIPREMDIDHITTKGLSCVAHAVLLVLLHDNLVHDKDITIVGRGHAAQGLEEALRMNHARVTVAHSGTRNMYKATEGRDVVVYATPRLTQKIAYDTKEMVIDLGNVVEQPERLSCDYINRIGKLTVSVVLNRFARVGSGGIYEH